jgi:uncharacterized protein YdeI (YjbR/CyaY-like superfamily)
LAQHSREQGRDSVHRRQCRSTPGCRSKGRGFRDNRPEPDTEKREVQVPVALQKLLGTTLTQKLNGLSFSHQKQFVVWYSEAKREDTRARRVEKMKDMLAAGKVIS